MNATYLTKQLKLIEYQLAIIRMVLSRKRDNIMPNAWKETAGSMSSERAREMLRSVERTRTEADRGADHTL